MSPSENGTLHSMDLPAPDRRPLRRLRTERYLVWMLLSFAFSVSITRLFLELTGYPQIGSRELHIAHVLWGGLALFVAALLPLILANRWVYMLTAIIGGLGIGLFIDEVGKFITQTNDYFYPPAAPIIYGLFILTFILYSVVRRPKPRDARSEMYYILEEIEEVLDHDLSKEERGRILERVERVRCSATDNNYSRLAAELEDFIRARHLSTRLEVPGFFVKTLARLKAVEEKWLTHDRSRGALAGGLLALGLWGVKYPLTILFSVRNVSELTAMLIPLVNQRVLRGTTTLYLFSVRVGLEGSIGLLLLVSTLLLVINSESRALLTAYFTLLTALTIVNPLLFYFEQFSMIIMVFVQFGLLLAIVRYRQRFIPTLQGITM